MWTHDLEDLNRAMQLALDIEEEITEAYEENNLAWSSIHSVSGHKVESRVDGFETNKQKKVVTTTSLC